MNGFGSIPRMDINAIIKKIENQIDDIKGNINSDIVLIKNKLNSCVIDLNNLKEQIISVKEYSEQEYEKLNRKVIVFDEQIEYIKSKLNTIQYKEINSNSAASGINYYPIWAKYAEHDENYNRIIDTYATKEELSSISGKTVSGLDELSGKLNDEVVRAETNESILSGLITNETTRAINKENELKNLIETEETRALNAEQTLRDDIELTAQNITTAYTELVNNVSGEIDNKIITISSNLDTKITNVSSELDNEIVNVSSNLNTKIDNVENELSTVSSNLETNLNVEIENRISACTELDETITNEKTRAINEEINIKNDLILKEQNITSAYTELVNTTSGILIENIENLSGELNTKIDTNVINLNTTINTEVSKLDNKIDTKTTELTNLITTTSATLEENIENVNERLLEIIETDIDDVTSAINDLQNELETEITNRIENDNELSSNISDEYTRSVNRENELEQLIETETTRALSAEENIKTDLNNVVVSATAEFTNVYNNLNTSATKLSNDIKTEIEVRKTKDAELDNKINNEVISLNEKIDTIEATQNVVDIVGTYQDLINYDTTNLKNNDKIQVLTDEQQENSTTIYNWNLSNWILVGKLGPYYTQTEINTELSKKQDNLSAGDGIDITNNLVSHSVKILENNAEEDTISGTIFTVYLKNNHYKVITFDNTITEIIFMIEKTQTNVLQETGFEFTCPEDTSLETLTFKVINDESKKIYTIIPDSYSSPNIYQGTIVNYKCTIGEYEVEE